MGNEYVFQILAGQNIDTLNRYRAGERTIVTACPHCFNTIGNEYGQLGGTFTIRHHAEYLAGLVAAGRLSLGADGLPARSVTYHESCHLCHGQGIRAAPREVLRALPGVDLIEMKEADWCCGSAGIYSLLEPDLSREVLTAKLDAVRASSPMPQVIATGNPGCLMQIGAGCLAGGLPVRVAHPVELLDEAYRSGGVYDAHGTPPR